MHYYQHHVGDYNRDTATLSITEHGAYRLLMDAYYVGEAALPASIDALCRICRAMSKLEREAVKSVVAAFFSESGGKLTHKRIEEELELYREQAERNRVNGKKGGRPPKNETQTKLKNNPVGSRSLTQTITHTQSETEPKQNPNQEPITNNQPSTSNEVDGVQGKIADRNPPAVAKSPKLKVEPVTDDWLAEMQKAYPWANVSAEWTKCSNWCVNNQQTASRKRFVNWLNRISPPPKTATTEAGLQLGWGHKFQKQL